ncbi:pyridoxamine 5'-phosphate oxidase family protein [Streptomyces sp. NPDC056121]|uniref:pyridoxamine 5'-phosphate oxidase family protein n=1 Tax=Streptomyces sp. NPDC056121 TaxID=3345718 RepID=UPI0035D6A4DC
MLWIDHGASGWGWFALSLSFLLLVTATVSWAALFRGSGNRTAQRRAVPAAPSPLPAERDDRVETHKAEQAWEREPTGTHARHEGSAERDRRTRQLDRDEALGLLGAVSSGRMVFTQHALPAVRPAHHLVEGDDVVVRLDDRAALGSLLTDPGAPAVVVAYEADVIDSETRLGWSVVVTGYARLEGEAEERNVNGDEERPPPWAGRAKDAVVRIRPDLVTGFCNEAVPH